MVVKPTNNVPWAIIIAIITIILDALAFIGVSRVISKIITSLIVSKKQYATLIGYKTMEPVPQRSLDDRITVSDIHYPTATVSSVLRKCEL